MKGKNQQNNKRNLFKSLRVVFVNHPNNEYNFIEYMALYTELYDLLPLDPWTDFFFLFCWFFPFMLPLFLFIL